MAHIRLTRIDDRFIHGQVAAIWAGTCNANLLLAVNDVLAQDSFRQQLMNMAVPPYARTLYFSVERACEFLRRASADDTIMIICESPMDVLRLVEGGAEIHNVNVGNMHNIPDVRRQAATSIFVDDRDVEAFRKLRDLGIELEIRRVPNVPAEYNGKLFE